jgi:formyl-CoA transferase
VKRIDDVLDGPQVSALGMIQHLETADRSTAGYDVLGVPLRFDRAPLELRAPAPLLGEDTADVLEELGYDPSEMQSLAESGVVAIKARRAASATRGET